MVEWLSEKKSSILFVGILILLLALISYHAEGERGQSRLEEALFLAGVPILKVVDWVSTAAGALQTRFATLGSLRKENETLRVELSRVRNLDPLREEFRMENERLRGLLGLRETLGYPSVGGRVLRMPSDPSDPAFVSIDPGGKVREKMAVLSLAGLVGQIQRVSGPIAKVQLITDRNSGIAALIQRNRAQGIVSGGGGNDLWMEYLRRGEYVRVGDIVLSSGLDGIFSKGILIGTVVDVTQGPGLTQKVKLKPAVDFFRLEEVLILLKKADDLPREEPDGSP